MLHRTGRPPRHGAILPLTALLLMLLLAMVAFAVDVGCMVVTEQELQNAADAAALAGASQLVLPRITTPNGQSSLAAVVINRAKSEAQTVSHLNQAANTNLDLLAGDIVVGTPSGSPPVTPWAANGPLPTTVQVTVCRNESVNGPVPLFFGPLLGAPSWCSSGTATGSFQAGPSIVTGFRPSSSGRKALLLPVAVDANYWSQLLQTSQSPDGQVHDDYQVTLPTASLKPPNNVANGNDYVPELYDIYPSSTSPGNFGLVTIGVPTTSTATFSSWVHNGPSPADVGYFGTNGLQATSTSSATLPGGPAWTSSLQTDLQSIIGQPRIVLLFSACSTQGQNTTYTVVGFAGVTVARSEPSGSSVLISLQPRIVVDPTATTTPGSTASSFIYNSSPLKLVR